MTQRILTPNDMMPPPVQQMLNVAAPMNDVQLVALVASNYNLPAKEAVERAVKIIVETVVQLNNNQLQKRIQDRLVTDEKT